MFHYRHPDFANIVVSVQQGVLTVSELPASGGIWLFSNFTCSHVSCLHMATSVHVVMRHQYVHAHNLWASKFRLIFLELFLMPRRTYYSQNYSGIMFSGLVVLMSLLVFPTMSVIHPIYKGSQNQHMSSVVSWLHRLWSQEDSNFHRLQVYISASVTTIILHNVTFISNTFHYQCPRVDEAPKCACFKIIW